MRENKDKTTKQQVKTLEANIKNNDNLNATMTI